MAKRPRPPRSLSVELADGRLLQAQTPARSGAPLRIRVVARIGARYFEACPICGDPATADEHVPPLSIGGRVMTRTCGPCNNGLGSRIEADLVDWHDDAVTLPAFSGNAVQGPRRTSRILHRATPDGDFVLLMDESTDPAVRELLLSGHVNLSAYAPNPNRERLALLKHSFLAACLVLGRLAGEGADAVRRDLIAARDATSRHDVPRSAIALGLTVLRSNNGPRLDWPVVHCVAELEDGTEVEGVTLAGTTFVSWSSDPVVETPEATQRVQATLTVGAPVGGVVRSVNDD